MWSKFKWKGRRYRGALDDVLRRHVSGKSEALREIENIYYAVRDGTFGRESAATLRLRQLGERYFKAYVSPKTGRPLGKNERYRWNVMLETKVHGRLLGDYVVADLKKHHVGSERAALVEPNDEGPAHPVHPALAGAARDARITAA